MIYLIIAAVILDFMIGDPRNFPHPVVIIGKVISFGEKLIRKIFKGKTGQRIGGIFLVIFVVGGTYLITHIIVSVSYRIHPYISILLQIIILYMTVSIKSLKQHSDAVSKPLKNGDLEQAREKLGMIVGRDTDKLNEKEITRGVVETVAENTVDGIVSPLFYAFIGGAPLALAYKAVNTLDSMVGYKEERFLYLGWASARFDDFANYIPARLAGILFLIPAIFSSQGIKASFQTIIRDAKKHPSPNGGITEAAVAGALGVKLGGTNYYFGKPSYRAEIGNEIVVLNTEHINAVLKLMYSVTFLFIALGLFVTIISQYI